MDLHLHYGDQVYRPGAVSDINYTAKGDVVGGRAEDRQLCSNEEGRAVCFVFGMTNDHTASEVLNIVRVEVEVDFSELLWGE